MAFVVAPDSPIVVAIKALYGTAQEVDKYLSNLIESMKGSANKTIEASGRVLEAAKVGFGLGFAAPMAVIAVGQMLLGHPFVAAATIVSSPVNPVALTCGAVGAIYFGWKALSEEERNGIVERVTTGLELGAELVKAIVAFVIVTTKELLNPDNIAEFKRFVGDAAFLFGRTVADVTRAIVDRATDAYGVVADKLRRPDQKDPPLPRLPL